MDSVMNCNYLPKTPKETPFDESVEWYAVTEVWKGTLVVADLEQVDKKRRVRIPQHKAEREGDDLFQIGDNSKNRRWTIKNVLEEIRF